jgi:hypothetical protein
MFVEFKSSPVAVGAFQGKRFSQRPLASQADLGIFGAGATDTNGARDEPEPVFLGGEDKGETVFGTGAKLACLTNEDAPLIAPLLTDWLACGATGLARLYANRCLRGSNRFVV